MAKKSRPVAKVRILVLRDGERWLLMSAKRRKRGGRGHGKLEMLGGHLEKRETPQEALLRECREEEVTGHLAELVAERAPPFASETVDGAVHHLFELTLSGEEADALEAAPHESLGLRLIRAEELDAGHLDDELTSRTRAILSAFGPAPGARA